jgi:2-polyprenyl-3-methyl-5-hydroxy-6-metoxy-1,4-benzoquinol methylase
METFDALTQFYNNYDEEGRLLSRHGSVEFLTTMRYIEKYLHEGMRILEIGAATGRYSHALARMGYRVDAVELVQHNIDILRENTQPGENVTIRQGNALDLQGGHTDIFFHRIVGSGDGGGDLIGIEGHFGAISLDNFHICTPLKIDF